jgi:hypothetical protein
MIGMRRVLPWMLVSALVLSLGLVAYTQRSGPTPEDKALAARLIQEALRDALLTPDPGERADRVANVFQEAFANAEDGQPAVRPEEATNLLRKALQDAEALPAEQQEEAIGRVLAAMEQVDPGEARQWAEETHKRGHPVPPEWLAEEETPTTDMAQDVTDTASEDLPAAIQMVQNITDPRQRMEAKLRLGSRLVDANLWSTQGRQLLSEAAALAERLAAEPGGQDRLLRVAQALASCDPERALSLYRRAYDAALAEQDIEQRVTTLLEISGRGGDQLNGSPGTDTDDLGALRARALQQAATEALKLPEGNPTRAEALQSAFWEALHNGEGEGVAQFDAALGWARRFPVADGSRSRALAEVADKARSVDRKFADDLVGEARDSLPPVDSNWDAVVARASTIAAAALAGDKRCWSWAAQDAALIRRSELPSVDDEFQVPVEIKRAVAETMVLGATFASGDIQRARKFVASQAQLGGYEAARALWTALVYVWDPSMSFDLADKLLADLGERKLPAGACTAALCVLPAFGYKALFPDAEGLDRAGPLLDRAFDLMAAAPQAIDRAFAAAATAVACASVDAARSARAVALARDALGAIADSKTREALAEPICAMVAIADPQTAGAMTADIKDPGARLKARLAAAKAMRFDLAMIRDNWPGILTGRSPGPEAFPAAPPLLPAP